MPIDAEQPVEKRVARAWHRYDRLAVQPVRWAASLVVFVCRFRRCSPAALGRGFRNTPEGGCATWRAHPHIGVLPRVSTEYRSRILPTRQRYLRPEAALRPPRVGRRDLAVAGRSARRSAVLDLANDRSVETGRGRLPFSCRAAARRVWSRRWSPTACRRAYPSMLLSFPGLLPSAGGHDPCRP